MRNATAEVPASQDELFREYYGYVRRLVARFPGIPSQDVDDVAMNIMTRILERDVLGMFDPELRFSHEGLEIPAKFRTFLTSQVMVYMRGQRDKLGRLRKHEAIVLDAPVPGTEDGTATLADLFGSVSDDTSELDAAEWIRQARGFLATVPRRSAADQCDLVRLFDVLVSQVQDTGECSVAVTAQALGVAPSAVWRWQSWLRQNLRQQAALSRRVQVAGDTYTLAHVRQALHILKTVKGPPFVRQPLERARNPLAAMDYHKLARFEIATFPECKVPALHQGKGHFAPHTLTAVVHHLERVAPEAAS